MIFSHPLSCHSWLSYSVTG